MFVRSARFPGSALVAAALIALTATGCANTGFLVERRDLNELEVAVEKQREEIEKLRSLTFTQQTLLMAQQTESTQQVLEAIDEKVKKPSCPPAPKQKACPATGSAGNTGDNGAQRLNNKIIVGELERFLLVGPGLVYVARIDSGATTSSIDARNMTRFERNGENWVRFDVPVPNSEGKLETLERKIVRNVRIVSASADEAERRPVVELQFIIGGHEQKAEFTLAEREHLSHSVLIGRNILRDVMLIDVGKEYATELPESVETEGSTSN
ncbi:ATP-dependent zinc protease [Marinobacter sp.]|uniref:ATP-dependent zinc protease family protein n=1 Tax=Marinobacter sp. TaxID=50741 RepID=UPI00384DC3AB